jgi:hypothetical protein
MHTHTSFTYFSITSGCGKEIYGLPTTQRPDELAGKWQNSGRVFGEDAGGNLSQREVGVTKNLNVFS